MKKLSKINEGLWKSGIERSRSGELRKEDRIPPNNLSELQEIDFIPTLPFVFADRNLEINGNEMISAGFYEHNYTKIEKSGWRLPTVDEIKYIQSLYGKEYKFCQNYLRKFENIKTRKIIDINPTANGYLLWKSSNRDGFMYQSLLIGRSSCMDVLFTNDEFFVRLIKDKK